MAVDAPLLTRQRVTAAKIETTTGTPESLANADAAMNIFDTQANQDIETNTREGQSSLSMLSQVPGSRLSRWTFRTELVGLGSIGTPLWADTFLAASGFVESAQVFTPVTGSAAAQTLTLGLYQDGRLKTATGAMGNWTMNLVAGQPVFTSWDFLGVYVAPSAAALLTPTYPTIDPPVFMGATVTIGGTSYKVSQVVLAMNNEVVGRQDATNAAGYHAATIVNRGLTVTMDPEALALGTKDWYADWLAGTEAALNIVVGSDANNTITIACPKLQLTEVQDGDRDGILTDQLTFQSNRSAAAGDDEISITFS